MRINELRPGAHLDITVEVKEVFPLRKFLICNNAECGYKHSIEADKYEKKCPDCGEAESKEARKGVWAQNTRSLRVKDGTGECYMDLWKDEAFRFKEGDKVHVINGFCRQNAAKDFNISSGRDGNLAILRNE